METTHTRSRSKSVIAGRAVALLRDDEWLPMKVINTFDKPITVKLNIKLADVYQCAALDSFNDPKVTIGPQSCIKQNVQVSSVSCCQDEYSLVTEDSSLPDHH